MATFLNLEIIGHLGGDPETRMAGDATVTTFTVAHNEKRRDVVTTTWVRVNAWGKKGEPCQKFLRKGSQVFASGRLRIGEYDAKDGTKRTTFDLDANDIVFLGSPQERSAAPPEGQTEASDIPF
jgi:single-strand DNA-binding protein